MSTNVKKERKARVVEPAARKRRLIIAAVVVVVLAIIAAVAGYFMTHYFFNREYQAFLPELPAVEQGSAYKPLEDADKLVPGFDLVADNGVLKLYAKPDTGEIAVYDTRNGNVVFSNPQDADNDKLANKTNRAYLRSQFIIEYYNSAKTQGTYDSFTWSTERGQMTVESIASGVRFIYDLGSKTVVDYYVSTYLSVEQFDKFIAQLQEQYDALLAEEASLRAAGDEAGANAAKKKGMQVNSDLSFVKAQYGNGKLNANGMYELITATAQIKNPPQPGGKRAKLFAILEPLGMTEELFWEQMELGGYEKPEDLGFVIAVEYRLNGDAVEVTVPLDQVQETGGGKLTSLRLLPYMGAAGMEETGSIVVPNGCGSLINFNNGRFGNAAYSQYVYDVDPVDADYTQTQNTMMARMALFGICRENSGVLATIEVGQAMARINADVAGRANSYNYAYPSFTVRGDASMEMFGVATGSGTAMHLIENDIYGERVTVRYTMLTAENKGYAGLANYYRNRLIAEGVLTLKAEGGDIPFYYDVIGGVKETAHTLGVQYLNVVAMTTFEQAGQIAQALKDEGIGRQVMNLQGWFNGGYYHDAANRISVLGKLGGNAGLKALNDRVKGLGGELFADVAFQKVTSITKHYMASFESSRYYGAGYTVSLGVVNPTTLRRTGNLGYMERHYTLLSPKFLPRYVKTFTDAFRGLGVDGISLRDLGDELHADKRRTEIISRQQALYLVQSQLKTLRESGRKLLFAGGNDYVFGAAEHLINVPMSGTEYFILDETIPLYQMILHGCVDYAGGAINVADSDNWRAELLRMVEYGASTHYVFTWAEASDMKYTGANDLYATTFTKWEKEAVANYQYVNGALSLVSNAAIVDRAVLEGGVVRVTYSNGVKIYVNYGDQPVEADGQTVPALDYVTVGGAA